MFAAPFPREEPVDLKASLVGSTATVTRGDAAESAPVAPALAAAAAAGAASLLPTPRPSRPQAPHRLLRCRSQMADATQALSARLQAIVPQRRRRGGSPQPTLTCPRRRGAHRRARPRPGWQWSRRRRRCRRTPGPRPSRWPPAIRRISYARGEPARNRSPRRCRAATFSRARSSRADLRAPTSRREVEPAKWGSRPPDRGLRRPDRLRRAATWAFSRPSGASIHHRGVGHSPGRDRLRRLGCSAASRC